MSDNPLLPHYLDQPGAPFGNYHHGTLDGTALADGGVGFVHPEIRPYVENARYWITPCLDLVVPGHSFTAPASPAAGVNWLDHAIVSGVYRTLYQTDAFPELSPLNHSNRFLVSFGVGDTWACTLNPSVAVDGSGGNASVGVSLVPFGRFNEDPVTADITLSSNTLAPCGQPSFAVTEDFPNTPLKLMPFDISPDGQKIILGVVDATYASTYFGYGAPRGFMLLELTKTTATLSLLKSRADMKVTGTQTISVSENGGVPDADFSCTINEPFTVTVPVYSYSESNAITSSNLIAAWFDAAGVVQYLRYDVSATRTRTINVTAYGLYVHGCPAPPYLIEVAPGASATRTEVAAYSGTVKLMKVGDIVPLKSATWSDGGTLSQSLTESGGGFNVSSSSSYTQTGTALGGTLWSDTTTTSATGTTTWNAPGISAGYWNPGWGVFAVYNKELNGPFTMSPTGFNESPTYGYPVSQVGMRGMIAHEIPFDGGLETFVGLLKHSTYATLPHDETQGMVICAHPKTGQIIYKYATLGASPAPSYGFV